MPMTEDNPHFGEDVKKMHSSIELLPTKKKY